MCFQVNPLAETKDGKLIAADAKLGFDDNAAFRQKELMSLRDTSQEDPRSATGQHLYSTLGEGPAGFGGRRGSINAYFASETVTPCLLLLSDAHLQYVSQVEPGLLALRLCRYYGIWSRSAKSGNVL